MKSKPSRKIAKVIRKPIEFNYDDLLTSLRDHRAHLQGKKKLTLGTWIVEVPENLRNNPHVKKVRPKKESCNYAGRCATCCVPHNRGFHRNKAF